MTIIRHCLPYLPCSAMASRKGCRSASTEETVSVEEARFGDRTARRDRSWGGGGSDVVWRVQGQWSAAAVLLLRTLCMHASHLRDGCRPHSTTHTHTRTHTQKPSSVKRTTEHTHPLFYNISTTNWSYMISQQAHLLCYMYTHGHRLHARENAHLYHSSQPMHSVTITVQTSHCNQMYTHSSVRHDQLEGLTINSWTDLSPAPSFLSAEEIGLYTSQGARMQQLAEPNFREAAGYPQWS